MDKKSSMMKDAIILCAITLILGAVLAGVYMLTKDPIDNAQKKTNNEACAVVVAQGDSVKDNDAEAPQGGLPWRGPCQQPDAEGQGRRPRLGCLCGIRAHAAYKSQRGINRRNSKTAHPKR